MAAADETLKLYQEWYGQVRRAYAAGRWSLLGTLISSGPQVAIPKPGAPLTKDVQDLIPDSRSYL